MVKLYASEKGFGMDFTVSRFDYYCNLWGDFKHAADIRSPKISELEEFLGS